MDKFEKALESDIVLLAEEVRAVRELPEMGNATELQLIKEAMRTLPRPANQPAPQIATPMPAGMASALPDYAQNASPEIKLEIEYLVDLAFRDGIGKALAQAEQSSAFVEDAVRDVLAGKLYPELKKEGTRQLRRI